ncbi:MAG: peptidoglycan editing factor PgeF [Candidatus Kerfeldbacteria bacterium]
MITFSNLSSLSGIEHGITEKGDQAPEPFIRGEQVHKDVAVWADENTPEVVKGADAIVTRKSGIIVATFTADCVPVLFADPKAGIVGAIHAGWRGTALEITRKTFEFLKIRPFNIIVGIGPAICGNCFNVDEKIARQFDASVVTESESEEGKFHVDIVQANIDQCLEAGIPEKNIEVIRRCTFEDDALYSSRGGDKNERMISFIRRNG